VPDKKHSAKRQALGEDPDSDSASSMSSMQTKICIFIFFLSVMSGVVSGAVLNTSNAL
jgi:hypothetical protein